MPQDVPSEPELPVQGLPQLENVRDHRFESNVSYPRACSEAFGKIRRAANSGSGKRSEGFSSVRSRADRASRGQGSWHPPAASDRENGRHSRQVTRRVRAPASAAAPRERARSRLRARIQESASSEANTSLGHLIQAVPSGKLQ